MNNELNPNNLKREDFYFTPEGYKCFTEKYHLKEVIAVKVVVVIVLMDLIKNRNQ